MEWSLEASPEFGRDFRKHCAKDSKFRRAMEGKIEQILLHPTHYKPLRAPLQGVRRVHVASSFALLFEPEANRRVVRLLRLAHHDEAYGP